MSRDGERPGTAVIGFTGTIPPLVLVVDDDLGARESIRVALEPRFRVMTAESGEQALDMLPRHRIDVLTLGLIMPGLDETETFRRIREIDSDVEIIVISAKKESFAGLVDTQHDAPAWMPKPFDTAELLQTVERAAERSRSGPRHRKKSRTLTVQEVFSHDIKNRLSGVVGFVHLLRHGDLDTEYTARALDAIEGNAHEAVTLAVNFLHAEEIDGGPLRLHKTAASLNQIVEKVVAGETPRGRLRRIDLRADLDARLPPVDLDIAMMSCALTNLISNALHYSFEGGLVRVETRNSGDDIILRVRDFGPGIPVEEVPELFHRYGRGAKSASTTSTGLGLYLVRTIVEAHGGSVSATFPPGGGTAFVIALPRGAP